jgi:hypothetical protein
MAAVNEQNAQIDQALQQIFGSAVRFEQFLLSGSAFGPRNINAEMVLQALQDSYRMAGAAEGGIPVKEFKTKMRDIGNAWRPIVLRHMGEAEAAFPALASGHSVIIGRMKKALAL